MAYWNAHTRRWDRQPSITGPIELYRPVEDGTESLPTDANFEDEFYGDYDSLDDAVDAIDCCGRWAISREDRGTYIGYLNSTPGAVELVLFGNDHYEDEDEE